jgi:hypothetical protein
VICRVEYVSLTPAVATPAWAVKLAIVADERRTAHFLPRVDGTYAKYRANFHADTRKFTVGVNLGNYFWRSSKNRGGEGVESWTF